MQNATFRAVLYGMPMDFFDFIFMAGTCEEADDEARWHFTLNVRANVQNPWQNPHSFSAGSGNIVRLNLWKDGGEVIHTFTDLDCTIYRTSGGMPWRIVASRNENGIISLDTGEIGMIEANTLHEQVEVPIGAGTALEYVCPAVLELEEGVID